MTDMHIQVPIAYRFIRSKEKIFRGVSVVGLVLREGERANTRRRHFKLLEEPGVRREGEREGNGGHRDVWRVDGVPVEMGHRASAFESSIIRRVMHPQLC